MGSSDKLIAQKHSQDYELISTTFHEAGHVICGLLNFMKINAVSVNPTDPEDIGVTH